MNIIINTRALKKNNISLGEFLVLLIGYFEINYKQCLQSLIDTKLVEKCVFDDSMPILSNNTKNILSKIFVESNPKIIDNSLDFDAIAYEIQQLYPEGNKPGTTYSWRDELEEISLKLKKLVLMDYTFTPEEAKNATLEYLNNFKEDTTKMQLLRNFLLNCGKTKELNSAFMTIIENNRKV